MNEASSLLFDPLLKLGWIGAFCAWVMWRDGRERDKQEKRDAEERGRQAEREERLGKQIIALNETIGRQMVSLTESIGHLISVTGLEVATRIHIGERTRQELAQFESAVARRKGNG